jgi:hypothetical protein
MKSLMMAAFVVGSASFAFAQCNECKNKDAEFEKMMSKHKAECKLCKENICGIPDKKKEWLDNWKKEHEKNCGKNKESACDAWKKSKSEGEEEIKKHHDGCDACKDSGKCDELRKKKEELSKKIADMIKKHKDECSKCKEKDKSFDQKVDEMKKKHQEGCDACKEGAECDVWNKKKEWIEKERENQKK